MRIKIRIPKKQTLKDVKEKWRTTLDGSVAKLSDHPLFCKHDHCKYWRGKKSLLTKNDEEEEED